VSGAIQLISDGDGLLVVGEQDDVEHFLTSEGLSARPFSLDKVRDVLNAGAAIAQSASDMTEQTGRWVKLTKESAETLRRLGMVDSKTSGVTHATLNRSSEVKQWLQRAGSPSALANNPAAVACAAGIMAQIAMQQLVDEITDYLVAIDRKLDAVLRAQTNQVLARLDGIDLAVKEAATVRETVGRISEVTWSKVQSSSTTILETQAYALRQLADLADQIEHAAKVDDLAEATKEAEVNVQKWLRVLAICVQLHDSVAVIELDRVMDTSPDEVEAHLLGLRAAREHRLETFVHATDRLLERVAAAVGRANSKVLLNPLRSPAVVASSNRVASAVQEFHEVLSIESGRQSAEARRWVDAASERWGAVREGGAEGLETVRNLTSETRRQALSATGKLAGKLAERAGRKSTGADASGGDEPKSSG